MRSSPARLRLVACVAMAVAGLAARPHVARAGEPPRATVVIDGEVEIVGMTPLEGDGSTPRADDVLEIGPEIFRGAAPVLRIRRDRGRTYEIAEDGGRTLVAIHVSDGGTTADWLLPPDEALAVPEADLAGLRGIAFDGWDDRFAPMLARIDPARCCVSIDVGLRTKVPVLPEGLRALRIEGFLDDPIDLRPVAAQTRLRRLVVDGANVRDWSPLAGMMELRHLEASILPDVAATVPTLPSLRTFSAGYDDEVTDASFVARFPALVELNLRGTGVTDLSPIERLEHILHVDATSAGVTRLPGGRVPSLRSLRILGHRVPGEELRAFFASNPQCAGDHSLRARFDAAVAGADGLRLRTGGQCHRRPLEEDTLYETSAPEELDAVLEWVALDEPASRSRCMCCGGPTLEFLRSGKIAASLTMHHGSALRWFGWPGDGRLTDDAADALCTWLTKHGAPTESPRQVAAREEAEAVAATAAHDALLGVEAGAAARACGSAEDLARVVRGVKPGTDDRILALVRLTTTRGGPHGSATRRVAELAARALRSEDPDRLAAVLLAVLTDPEASADLRLAAAEQVCALDGGDGPISTEALASLRIPAARGLIAGEGSRRLHAAVGLLERARSPEATALAVSLLPPVDDEGKPTAQPTSEQMELAAEIATFCAESDLPRIRALAEASRDPRSWSSRIEERIEERIERRR